MGLKSHSLSASVKELVKGGGPLGRRVYKLGVEGEIVAGSTNLFNVNFGDILLVAMYGEVNIVVGNAGATTLRLQHNPTGTPPATNMCGNIANIDQDPVGTIYTWDGTIAGALIEHDCGVVVPSLPYCPQILVPGVITEIFGLEQTGAISWVLHYIPLDTDSEVVAV